MKFIHFYGRINNESREIIAFLHCVMAYSEHNSSTEAGMNFNCYFPAATIHLPSQELYFFRLAKAIKNFY